ncbi:MAG TPA: PD-(D/E)XK nuclease family protein, partial [Bacteroidales bacterium]|nr:PD-(D/E)XK nuclease family protein [Bacteroidales bacterium]
NLPELVSDIRFETRELRWGNKLHAYLSLVKQKESVDYVKQLISDDIQLEDNEKQTFLRVLDNIKLNAHSNVLFGVERAVIKTEVEILDAEARSFRIDRLVTDGQRTVVIDFKTGLKETSHKNQVMNYVELLYQTGYTAIEAYLVYISMEGDLEFIKI